MNRFTHFELVTDDFEKTAEFYRAVFGWNVYKWEGPVDYWLVETGDTSTPGINGGLMKRPAPDVRNWLNYIAVESVEATVAKAREKSEAWWARSSPA